MKETIKGIIEDLAEAHSICIVNEQFEEAKVIRKEIILWTDKLKKEGG